MEIPTAYTSRIITPAEAVRKVKSGDRIFLTGNCSVPKKLFAALLEYAPNLHDVEIAHTLVVLGSEYVAPEMAGHLRVNSLFISGNVRKAVQQGSADFTPVMLSEFPLVFKNRVLPVNVAFAHLSTPDEDGYCSFGVETGLAKSPVETADMIIAEINDQMPRPCGDTKIHISKLDYIIPVSYPLDEYHMNSGEVSDEVVKIAHYIADLIPNGATLQLGIGEIPDAVTKYLVDKKDLGIHTELFSDGLIDLVEAGVITGKCKTLHPGKIVAGFLLGSRRLYDWAHENPLVEIHPTEYVNDPFIIAQNSKMTAINSAIEIDLTGQVCADSIGNKLYSGVGGQVDFIYGASRSQGGLPIIALPSTTCLRDGTLISRITPTLKVGAGVVTSRSLVHYIITEYGAVDLYGKSIRKRAEALISIAHPMFRDELRAEAKKLNYL